MIAIASLSLLDPSQLEGHRRYLLRFAMSRGTGHDAAEDLVQEVFLAALDSAQRYSGASTLRTWLAGILLHKLADHRRRQARETSIDAHGEDGVEQLLRESGAWRNPEDALADRRFFQTFERCLEGLSRSAARAFLLRETLGLSTPEICARLDVSTTNCHVLLHRARVGLRDCLQQRWFAAERQAT
ncbi:MAG: sigma-70 family RNA polymerase sigma factor [Betaproteobacteria bacterium]